MILAASHAVVASADVPRIARFFTAAFGIAPRFENPEFAEFVLPSGYRIAFFAVTGTTRRWFNAAADRGTVALGVTVPDAEAAHARISALGSEYPIEISGPPREHPWGEKSFLIVDPDGNRWEIAQSPTPTGMLVERDP